MRVGIGIDTGGTYTDAVAYDFERGQLLGKGKALTTRENLSQGIGAALDKIDPELIRNAVLVSLSTTLATNACLEDKGGRAKLLVFGLTDDVLFPNGTPMRYGIRREEVRCVDTHGSYDGLNVDEPDWDAVMEQHGRWLADADTLAVAELYSMHNGAPAEKRMKTLSAEQFDLPCICANEITNELNVVARGATALLNARLLPIVREFVRAAREDFAARGCSAEVMVVRSDGSLMSCDATLTRPVETILSGPAASVLAGKSVCPEKDYIVVDMGGTTTDISIVTDGKPVMDEHGIQIGDWRTLMHGVHVSPYALGGDSTVRIVDEQLQLSPRRATPLCVAASRWPEILSDLRKLRHSGQTSHFPLHEFFYLVREPAEQKTFTESEQALIELLRSGPCMLGNLQKECGIDLYSFKSERLETEGIIMRAGMTPTDFMHIKGDFTEYNREASELAAHYLLKCQHRINDSQAIQDLANEAYDLVQRQLYQHLVRLILARRFPTKFAAGTDEQMEFLINRAWEQRTGSANSEGNEGSDPLFSFDFGTKVALLGVGAPTHVFLPAVAKVLGAQCILPEHAEVANALGALMADINAVVRVQVDPSILPSGETQYITHTPEGSIRYKSLSIALAHATLAAKKAALELARARGAHGELKVHVGFEGHSATGKDGGNVNLGETVVASVEVKLT